MSKRISKSLLGLAGLGAAVFAAVPAQADGLHRHGHGFNHYGPPGHGNFWRHHRHGPRTVVVYRPVVAVPGAVILAGLAPRDRRYVVNVLETAPTGRRVVWVNPDLGAHYIATPTRTYYATAGQPCREYSVRGDIGGHEQEIVGTACRQSDGSWREVN